jgi:hypothetical protein
MDYIGEEEEIPLDDEIDDQPKNTPKVPISYEDSDDYAPFDADTDSEET